jgi:capsular exopolysaccharide synthesis family protein
MLALDSRESVAGAEEFRTLRSHLYLIRDRQPLQKLLVTSPLPLEGKTFTALNLAQVIVRQQERRVLLIDADLRRSRLHVSLGAPAFPGLSDYLSGVADEFDVVQRGPLDNLFFIPGGTPSPNPSELIANGRLRLLLQRVGPAFDWIVVDSPPMLPVSDAKLLAELCDGVLVLIRAGATPYDLAQKACQELPEKRLLGVVLNRVAAAGRYNSYYYDRKDRPNKKIAVEGDRA